MNVKIVSTMLNEVRSILADTLELESFQINQFHNKDLSQHLLNWPGEFFSALCMNVSLFLFQKICVPYGSIYFAETWDYLWKHASRNSLLKFLPQHKHWGFYSDKKCKFLSKALKKNDFFLENKWLQWHII